MNICAHPWCRQAFDVTEGDRALLETLAPKIGNTVFPLPPPTRCPDCRQQRRSAHVNEMHLYKRVCDLTGKHIISDKHPSSPHIVYEQEAWYSDQWDPLDYGKDVDFTRPFFEQFGELALAVPYPNLFTGYQYDENCDYTNYAGRNKNCYLVFDSDEDRDCYYSYSLNSCINCVDCYRLRHSELCYECIDCYRCYGSSFLQECVNCSDCLFSKNCIGCRNCLMCFNLHNAEYCVENQRVTKEEYERYRSFLRSRPTLMSARERCSALKMRHPQKHLYGVQNENVSGDYLTECKDARHCFDGIGLWDCAYIFRAFYPLKNSMDCEAPGGDERLYECSVVGYNAQNVFFSANCLDQVSDLFYCSFCFHSSNLFGCAGLRHKQYCIFNKQYSKEGYEELVPRIIEHMQRTNEWGEFFPITHSLFAYNETLAQDYYPLTKEDVTARGYCWRERDPKEYVPQGIGLPDTIAETSDSVTQQTLACASCGRNYKIVPQELDHYRKTSLPTPLECFFCRHKGRMLSRNPRKLYERSCMQCGKSMQTTYSPERPEKVFCEECYLKTTY